MITAKTAGRPETLLSSFAGPRERSMLAVMEIPEDLDLDELTVDDDELDVDDDDELDVDWEEA